MKQLRIAITGVPGTGKTTLAKALSQVIGAKCISLSSFLPKLKAKEYCKELDTHLVEVEEVEKLLLKELENERCAVVEGHLIPELAIDWDLVFVLRCPVEELEKRLRARGYSEEKIRENVEAELIDYCGYFFSNPVYLDGASPVDKNLKAALEKLRESGLI